MFFYMHADAGGKGGGEEGHPYFRLEFIRGVGKLWKSRWEKKEEEKKNGKREELVWFWNFC